MNLSKESLYEIADQNFLKNNYTNKKMNKITVNTFTKRKETQDLI